MLPLFWLHVAPVLAKCCPCFGYMLHPVWLHVAPILATHCPHFSSMLPPFLATCCLHNGYALPPFWLHVAPIVATCCPRFGYMLPPFRLHATPVLAICRPCFGNMLSLFWLLHVASILATSCPVPATCCPVLATGSPRFGYMLARFWLAPGKVGSNIAKLGSSRAGLEEGCLEADDWMHSIANSAYLHQVPHTISIYAYQSVPKSLWQPTASKRPAMYSAQYGPISFWCAVVSTPWGITW